MAQTPETQSAEPRSIDLLASVVEESRPVWVWCRTCGYSLFGLPAGRCPECGHSFDPANPFTVTTERGVAERIQFGRVAAASLIVMVVLPVALAPFTDSLCLDLTAIAGIVLSVGLIEGRTKRGDWLAWLFGIYLLVAIAFNITLNPIDAASWTVRRHHTPVWHPLLVAVLSAVSLTMWRRWSLARTENMTAEHNR